MSFVGDDGGVSGPSSPTEEQERRPDEYSSCTEELPGRRARANIFVADVALGTDGELCNGIMHSPM